MTRVRSDQPDAAPLLKEALSKGGVVVVPTDTLYGLSTPISNLKGIKRIVALKRCGDDHQFLYLAANVDMVERYIDGWGCVSRGTLERIWPAPLTAVFRHGARCPDWVGETIAFRIPRHALVREAVAALGEPILSTSVNETGHPPLEDADAIERGFDALVDLIVDEGRLAGREPSTVVDFTGEAPVVLRAGSYDWEAAGNPSN
jgi:L-threonylcarbamoyladenylate synthase